MDSQKSKIVPELLAVTDLTHLLQISERTIWRQVATGAFPSPVAIGRCRRWRRTDIDDYMANLASARH